MRKTCLDSVYDLARDDSRIVFMGSDLGVNTLSEFRAELPNQFYMEGVSEAALIGMAAGLAMEGKIPYVNTIATFLTRRCYDQLAVDVCLHRLKVRLIGNGGGLVYAPLGPTHEAIEDIAILRALPNMTILAPADADEMRRLLPQTVDHPGPIYIRLAKGHDPIVSDPSKPVRIGAAIPMTAGTDALIATTGITLGIALTAHQQLARQGVESTVLHLPTIKPLDVASILQHAEQVPVVVSVEEHSVIGGLGGAIAEVMAEADFAALKRFRRIGIPDCFPDQYGSQQGLMESYGITADSIVSVVTSLLAN